MTEPGFITRFKLLVRRWPRVDRFLKWAYYGIREVAERYFLGTRVQEYIWKRRRLYGSTSPDTAFQESASEPHRQFVIQTIASRCPFSVLEIGCNAGVNLYLLSRLMSRATLHGLDINVEAIREGQERFQRLGVSNIMLGVGRADDLTRYDAGSIDVVFTDAALMYIGPDKIDRAVAEIVRVAGKAGRVQRVASGVLYWRAS